MGIHRESSSAREIEMLYQQLLDSWNRRDAAAMAALFTEDGNTVGFDGSQMNGRVEIEYEIGQIFADHQTAAYVGKVREVRFLTPDVALLRSVAGLVPPGTSEINPAANSVQSLVATRQNGTWRVALYHNTPAQYHGRPELVKQLTEELQQLVRWARQGKPLLPSEPHPRLVWGGSAIAMTTCSRLPPVTCLGQQNQRGDWSVTAISTPIDAYNSNHL